MAYIGGGQAGGGTVQERTSTRPPPTYRSGGREFESRDGMQAYDSLVACRRAGLDSCPSYSRIMQMAYGKFNAAIEACRGNKRCIDNVPGFNLDDIYQAGVYARTDAPLKKRRSRSQSKSRRLHQKSFPNRINDL